MNLPSFAEFKKNQSSYYAFATILALIFIFSLWVSDRNEENERKERALKECAKERKEDALKVDKLQEKLLIIVQKQSIKDSIK